MRYKFKKIYNWNPELAYLVGLIASDGCLVNNGRHINITSKDFEIINAVQRILTMDVKVAEKLSIYGGKAYHLQFSNVALYDFLLSCNLTPAKSKTIEKLAIPDQFYSHFLRGYFDGDGTIYGYWDKRWPKSLMYYTGFASASSKFLYWLSENNAKLIKTSPGKIKPGVRVLSLNYAKRDSQKLFGYMYQGTMSIRLKRKYDKFVAFLESDPYADSDLHARVLESVDRPA